MKISGGVDAAGMGREKSGEIKSGVKLAIDGAIFFPAATGYNKH